eukprot:5076495-Pyramimonas_sp.AAC.1
MRSRAPRTRTPTATARWKARRRLTFSWPAATATPRSRMLRPRSSMRSSWRIGSQRPTTRWTSRRRHGGGSGRSSRQKGASRTARRSAATSKRRS